MGSNGGCNNIAGLVKEQKSLCRKYPKMMEVVGQGAKLGLQECQHQFATSKWNCSHLDQRKKGLLGLLTSKGKKDNDFTLIMIRAIISFILCHVILVLD